MQKLSLMDGLERGTKVSWILKGMSALLADSKRLSIGEEVGAAVVLREGMAATEKELREYTATRLADFKVPRKVLFMDEIPKGSTGKLQRIGMAQKLGLA